MLSEIPDEILNLILSKLDISPKKIYNLRSICKNFKINIDKIKNLDLNNFNYEDTLNRLSYSGLKCNFKWLFNNNIKLSINNINNLIINDRYDILKLLLKYDYLKYVLFNISTKYDKNCFDIISLCKSDNPLIICGTSHSIKNNLEIIKLLLFNKKDNPYLNQIPGLFEICIKYNNIEIIDYLIKNYFIRIKNHIHKINNLILKSNKNMEDLLDYLIINNLYINEDFICNLIKKKYIKLAEKILFNDKITDTNHILSTIVKTKNIYLYNLVKNKYIFEHSFIILILTNNICDQENKKFIEEWIKNDINKISNQLLLINLCIKNKIKNEIILKLIDMDFIIYKNDIQLALDNDNIMLVEKLSIKYNSI
jgi:hypothetical protein